MKIKFTIEIDPCGGMTPADESAVAAQLNDIAARLNGIAAPVPEVSSPTFAPKGIPRMATPASITTAIADINTATNNLASVVTDLRSKVGVGMTQADVDEVDAQLASIATQLTGIAADPNNPVPPAPQAPKAKKH